MKNLKFLLLLALIYSVSNYGSQILTIPVTKSCLQKTLKHLKMIHNDKNICKSIEYTQFTENHREALEVVGYLKISKKDNIESKFSELCKHEMSSVKKNLHAYSLSCLNTSKVHIERTGDNDKDFKKLQYLLKIEKKKGRNTHHVVITDNEITIIHKEISNN